MLPQHVVGRRFEVEGFAGSGGLSAVYRARDRQGGAVVALKVLHAHSGEHAERFQREARLLATLSHPGIVRYVAHGRTPAGEHFLAMEWLEGETLAQRLVHAGMSVAESLALARRVGEALGEAHRHGVVHRDVKPANIFLPGGRPEEAKILDFGLARLGNADVVTTHAGTVLGTPAYMAPEQARGLREIDAAADVFSLGCVLFECLTGESPFAGEHVMAVLAKVLLQEAPRVAARREVPPALDSLVARMLAKEPAERPRDGTATAAAIALLDDASEPGGAPAAAAPALGGGERRQLSLVVATLQGADATGATLLERAAPAPTASLLKEAASPFAARVELLAGGTALVVLTGQGAATDQAARAARCARALREAIPHAAIGVATGWSELAGGWPMGEIIDRAARLAAKPGGEIRLDETTAGLLDQRFDVGGDDAGLVLRGEHELPVAPRTLLGRPTSFVGRDAELAVITALHTECLTAPGARAVLVTGPAGAGKTRLRQELLRRFAAEAEVWIGYGDPVRAGAPLALIAPMLRRAAGQIGGEPLAVRQRKLRARVARHLAHAEVARVAEFLGELVDTPFPDEDRVQLRAARQDPMVMAEQTKRAWEDFLDAECAAGPLVLVLEDLHWADLATVRFVDAALRHLRERPFFVLALARPEVAQQYPGLWLGHAVTELRLGELPRAAGQRLVVEALGDRVAPAEAARLAALAEGNAFFLEEIIRAAADGKVDAIPGTVVAMLDARVAALPAGARRVLRAASVFGQLFWPAGLVELLGGDALAAEWLPELERRELVVRKRERRFAGVDEFAFPHALVREAAYASLTDADRRLGHALAGGWLERAGESAAQVVAEHYERGGEPRRAVAWYQRAAEQALGANDLGAALQRARHGLDCGAAGEIQGALLRTMAEAHQWRAEHADAERAGALAMTLLPVGSDAWCGAAAEVAVAAGKLGHHARLLEVGSALLWLCARPAGGPAVIAAARCAVYLMAGGDDALALADRLIAWIEAADDVAGRAPAVDAWRQRARAFRAGHAGDIGASLRWMESSAAGFERAGDVRNACLQRGNAGYDYVLLGDTARAAELLRGVLAEAERMGAHHIASTARQNLALALWRLGRLDEARSLAQRSADEFAAHGDGRMASSSYAYLADVLLALGDAEGAARAATAALDAMRAVGGHAAEALAACARGALAGGRAAEARAFAAEAVGLLDVGTAEEGEAAVRLAHIEALTACGDAAAARSAILVAAERLRARAAGIDEARLRRSFLEQVPENATTLALAAALDSGDGTS